MDKQGEKTNLLSKLIFVCLLTINFPSKGKIVTDFGINAINNDQKVEIENWLKFGHQAVVKTLGPITQTHIPVTIDLTLSAREAVPWGQVIRGKSDGIELRVSKVAPLDALRSDWTLYHELSHLYHPLFAYQDFWLAEGFATYFQNIVMLENSIYNEAEFKVRMRKGLARGRLAVSTHSGRLDKVSSDMWRLRAYQRVYWTGVAFFIEAEHALRKANAKQTVVGLVSEYQSCCRKNESEGRKGSALEFVRALDRLSGHEILFPLYQRYRSSKSFPEIENEQLQLLIKLYSP
ncbi:M1 family metallopeptidase [Pseudoalteromonas luteoviolacea]|uniref:M1 family metallopeptidase n=1 Tax=Pseudoalteromonas luteoviolacea TaxID=43657 RepID=UPI0011511229|nr:M1 family metallopeptidase [Pseudoalteromonas luteoviolacea]TQF69794.1 M1 family metallopeptidase [Pseudoalteromonas luteoviolacea]